MSVLGQLDRKTIVINSQYRQTGTPSSFTWKFSERVEGVRHAELRLFVLENGVYNVEQEINGTFFLSESFVSATYVHQYLPVVIPTGYYDDKTISSTLGLVMSAVSLSQGAGYIYNCNIDTQGFLTITASPSVTGQVCSFAVGFTNGTGTSYPATAQTLGFFNITPEFYASGLPFFSSVRGDLTTIIDNFDYLFVQSQKLGGEIAYYGGGIGLAGNSSPNPVILGSPANAFAYITNTTPTNNTGSIIYENTRPPQISTLKFPFSLDYVDINILDKYGRIIDATNQNVSMVIELYVDKKGQDIPTNRGNYFY
jgi:hypothetical protein